MRRPSHYGVLVPDTSTHHPQNIGRIAAYGRTPRPVRSRNGGRDAVSSRRDSPSTEERDAVTESYFQSNLSHWTYWYVAGLYCTVLYDVNVILFQYAPNLLNVLLIHTTNANATVDITITVLNNFELKRDTIQTKNYLPAQ